KIHLSEAFVSHPGKVRIGQNEIHFERGMPPARIAMAHQCRPELVQILRRFECVEIVWAISQRESCRPKLFEAFAIAQAHTPPVYALQHHDRTVEMKSGDRQQMFGSLPKLASQIQSPAPGLRRMSISQPPSRIEP